MLPHESFRVVFIFNHFLKKDSKDIEERTQKYIIANEKTKQLIVNAEREKELNQSDLLNLVRRQ